MSCPALPPAFANGTMNEITIRYFASLRDERGLAQERLQAQGTAAELYDRLAVQHGFSLERDRVRVAVNDAFVDWSTALKPADSVVFIPPVAGG